MIARSASSTRSRAAAASSGSPPSAILPSELIFDVQAERAGGTLRDGYTVDQVYGLVGEAWCFSHEIQKGTGPIQMEDFGEALDAMRAGLDELSEDKSAASRSVEPREIEVCEGCDAR